MRDKRLHPRKFKMEQIFYVIYNYMSHKSEDYKISAVKYYLENRNVSMDDVCDIFKCAKTSLKRWIDKYHKSKSLTRNNKKSMSYKITKTHVKEAIKLLKKNE